MNVKENIFTLSKSLKISMNILTKYYSIEYSYSELNDFKKEFTSDFNFLFKKRKIILSLVISHFY